MTLTEIADALTTIITAIKSNMQLPALILLLLWCIHIINWLSGGKLRFLGIYPRHWVGIPGILCSPFIHANAEHLLFNSIPLFLLTAFLLSMLGPVHFMTVSLWIVVLSGVFVWLVGRKAIHIGASGVIMGYWAYILTYAWRYPSITSVILCAVMLYYLGGLALSLFPAEEKVSWEGHCCGALAGVIVAYASLGL